MDALLVPFAASYPSSDESNPHIVDLPHTARLYKTLLQGGHFSQREGSIVPSPRFAAREFASALVGRVGAESARAMARDGGAFVLAELLERVRAECGEGTRKEVLGWFDGLDLDDSGDVKGWAVFVEKLQALRGQA